MLSLWIPTLAAVLAAAPDAGPSAYDPRAPSTWRLSAKLAAGSAARLLLVKDLTARPHGPGEEPLSPAEAEALLDDPRAELVYGEKTVSIVAPSMVARHRREHQDLLKAFLAPERIAAGVLFARERAGVLERARKKHGVDPAVVVSILMWESRLGTVTGEYVAFNSFASQAFFVDEANEVALHGPAGEAKAKGFDPAVQKERVEHIRDRAYKNLLSLARGCKARGMDALAVKGSWAGALGFPQFMPASLRWAEDGDGDGKIDLYTFDDSIASIARYLAEHGFAKSREDAVWAYNHEAAYVAGVLGYAKALAGALAAPADAGVSALAGSDAGPPSP